MGAFDAQPPLFPSAAYGAAPGVLPPLCWAPYAATAYHHYASPAQPDMHATFTAVNAHMAAFYSQMQATALAHAAAAAHAAAHAHVQQQAAAHHHHRGHHDPAHLQPPQQQQPLQQQPQQQQHYAPARQQQQPHQPQHGYGGGSHHHGGGGSHGQRHGGGGGGHSGGGGGGGGGGARLGGVPKPAQLLHRPAGGGVQAPKRDHSGKNKSRPPGAQPSQQVLLRGAGGRFLSTAQRAALLTQSSGSGSGGMAAAAATAVAASAGGSGSGGGGNRPRRASSDGVMPAMMAAAARLPLAPAGSVAAVAAGPAPLADDGLDFDAFPELPSALLPCVEWPADLVA
jgi:hypothetical protein